LLSEAHHSKNISIPLKPKEEKANKPEVKPKEEKTNKPEVKPKEEKTSKPAVAKPKEQKTEPKEAKLKTVKQTNEPKPFYIYYKIVLASTVTAIRFQYTA
jgi:hypothetical protein